MGEHFQIFDKNTKILHLIFTANILSKTHHHGTHSDQLLVTNVWHIIIIIIIQI